MKAHVGIPHVSIELGLGYERGDGIQNNDRERSAADERVENLERLLAAVRLRDDKVIDIDADALRERKE